MARKERTGICHLCGSDGKLSFEHVPPEAAFNDQRVFEADLQKFFRGEEPFDPEHPRGRYQQRGAGAYTLCPSCNSNTGAWYGSPYVRFAQALYPTMRDSEPGGAIRVNLDCRPHAVLKQILVMFCSANPPDLLAGRPDLARYLLNSDSTAFPLDFGIHLGLFDLAGSEATRQSGMSHRLDAETGKAIAYSEISFPPFHLVLTHLSAAPDPRLFDITWFRMFRVDEQANVRLDLQVLKGTSYLPGLYA